jgi:hypothetical protein
MKMAKFVLTINGQEIVVSFKDAESMIWENRRYIDKWDFILYGTKNRKYHYSDEDPYFDYWKLIV